MNRSANNRWIIRVVRPGDAKPIARLFYDTVHEINSRDYAPAQIDAWAPKNMEPGKWARSLAGKSVFVAEEDGDIVGFAELESDGRIDRLYCHSKRQRCGIGSGLMKEIEKAARRQGISKLYTDASITARPFFERCGFESMQEKQVEIGDISLTNFAMQKLL